MARHPHHPHHVMEKRDVEEGHAMRVRVQRVASVLVAVTPTGPVVTVHPIVDLGHRPEALEVPAALAVPKGLAAPAALAVHPIPSDSWSTRCNSMPMKMVCSTRASCYNSPKKWDGGMAALAVDRKEDLACAAQVVAQVAIDQETAVTNNAQSALTVRR